MTRYQVWLLTYNNTLVPVGEYEREKTAMLRAKSLKDFLDNRLTREVRVYDNERGWDSGPIHTVEVD